MFSEICKEIEFCQADLRSVWRIKVLSGGYEFYLTDRNFCQMDQSSRWITLQLDRSEFCLVDQIQTGGSDFCQVDQTPARRIKVQPGGLESSLAD